MRIATWQPHPLCSENNGKCSWKRGTELWGCKVTVLVAPWWDCHPKDNPLNFCAVSCCCSIFVVTSIFLPIFYNPPSSEDYSPTSDTPLLLNLQSDSFITYLATHTMTLDTGKYPNTYGAVVYWEKN